MSRREHGVYPFSVQGLFTDDPQSKQYLQTHCIAQAHKADIFALAATPTQIISGSGSSDLHIHNITFSPDDNVPYPLTQTLSDAHKLGTHHICVSRNGSTFTSVGFGGDVKLWTRQADEWVAKGRIVGATFISRLDVCKH